MIYLNIGPTEGKQTENRGQSDIYTQILFSEGTLWVLTTVQTYTTGI